MTLGTEDSLERKSPWLRLGCLALLGVIFVFIIIALLGSSGAPKPTLPPLETPQAFPTAGTPYPTAHRPSPFIPSIVLPTPLPSPTIAPTPEQTSAVPGQSQAVPVPPSP